ncbi:MAG TPA: carboxypeptidase regulatory-like domain-containing protein [Gemmatimonadales bacterium]
MMRRFEFAAVIAVSGLALGLAGRPGDAAAPASQQGATVTGRVKFTGTRPTNPRVDMSEEAACKAKYTTAPPTAETVVVNANGTLANVFVYVKTGLPAGAKYPAPATPVVIDQDGCRYHPHVLGIMVGQTLEIRNSDPVLHNIKAKATKNRPFNVSQPSAGMKTNRTFAAPEVMVALECNVHGWMNAFVGVLPHPFYAVTGADGSFSLKGLPAGTYTIEAWHEKYGTQTATVTVTGTETKTADLTFAAR